MWDQMSEELRRENQQIFIAHHDRVARTEFDCDAQMDARFRDSETVSSMPPYLRHCFDDALMNKAPSDVYVAVPTCLTRFRIGLLACIPSGWRQYIIQRKYKQNIANILKV